MICRFNTVVLPFHIFISSSSEQELDDVDEDADDEEEAYQSMVESMKHLLEAVGMGLE